MALRMQSGKRMSNTIHPLLQLPESAVAELVKPTLQQEPMPTPCPVLFGFIQPRHQWTYLIPSREQLEEVRRLLTNGEGSLGNIGAMEEDVFDRVCKKCLRAENRLPKYIEALKRARGEDT